MTRSGLPGRPAPVDTESLRQVLGHFVTGVTVVTATADDGRPVGITANSFTSVSLEPPLVLFCISNQSATGWHIRRSGAFAVNILSIGQQEVSRRFAARLEDRFAGVDIGMGATGSPILLDALACVECRIVGEWEGGDHLIVLGHVIEARVLRTGLPLTFFRSAYGLPTSEGVGATELADGLWPDDRS